MNEVKDFESFYSVKLEPLMGKLKAQTKAADAWGIIGLIAFVLSILIVFLGSQIFYLKNYGVPVIAGFTIAAFALFKYRKKIHFFSKDYKQLVIKEIINHIHPGIVYKPDRCISEKEYKRSSLSAGIMMIFTATTIWKEFIKMCRSIVQNWKQNMNIGVPYLKVCFLLLK